MIFDTTDLANLQEAQEAHMMDTCIIQTRTATYNSFGEPIETFTDGTAIACGLDMRPGSERHQAVMTLTEYDATLRLPYGTVINEKDRVKITHRFGVAITNITYQVQSPIQRGPSGIRLILRKVDP